MLSGSTISFFTYKTFYGVLGEKSFIYKVTAMSSQYIK